MGLRMPMTILLLDGLVRTAHRSEFTYLLSCLSMPTHLVRMLSVLMSIILFMHCWSRQIRREAVHLDIHGICLTEWDVSFLTAICHPQALILVTCTGGQPFGKKLHTR